MFINHCNKRVCYVINWLKPYLRKLLSFSFQKMKNKMIFQIIFVIILNYSIIEAYEKGNFIY